LPSPPFPVLRMDSIALRIPRFVSSRVTLPSSGDRELGGLVHFGLVHLCTPSERSSPIFIFREKKTRSSVSCRRLWKLRAKTSSSPCAGQYVDVPANYLSTVRCLLKRLPQAFLSEGSLFGEYISLRSFCYPPPRFLCTPSWIYGLFANPI